MDGQRALHIILADLGVGGAVVTFSDGSVTTYNADFLLDGREDPRNSTLLPSADVDDT
jgi:butyrate kinase